MQTLFITNAVDFLELGQFTIEKQLSISDTVIETTDFFGKLRTFLAHNAPPLSLGGQSPVNLLF
ncbi:MAG: hypothetical protein KGZ92_05770 [Firmicutes bacterium]|nr:hypothetical protein [Bacillota bacterium]